MNKITDKLVREIAESIPEPEDVKCMHGGPMIIDTGPSPELQALWPEPERFRREVKKIIAWMDGGPKPEPEPKDECFDVTVKGFKTRDEAETFMSWYEGQGEQDAAVWFECRQDEGKDVRTFLPTQCIDN